MPVIDVENPFITLNLTPDLHNHSASISIASILEQQNQIEEYIEILQAGLMRPVGASEVGWRRGSALRVGGGQRRGSALRVEGGHKLDGSARPHEEAIEMKEIAEQ